MLYITESDLIDPDRSRPYVDAVRVALIGDALPANANRTNYCTECDTELWTPDDFEGHVVWQDTDAITLADLDYNPVIIIGCEGYWFIDPNMVGIPSDTWTPVNTWLDWAEMHYDDDHADGNPDRQCPLCDPNRPEQAITTEQLADIPGATVIIDNELWHVGLIRGIEPDLWEVVLDTPTDGDADRGVVVNVDNPGLRLWVLA